MMAERIPLSGGPLSGCVIEGELHRAGVELPPTKRYPDRIFVLIEGAQQADNAALIGVPFTAGAEGLLGEYEFDPTDGYTWVGWSRKVLADPPAQSAN